MFIRADIKTQARQLELIITSIDTKYHPLRSNGRDRCGYVWTIGLYDRFVNFAKSLQKQFTWQYWSIWWFMAIMSNNHKWLERAARVQTFKGGFDYRACYGPRSISVLLVVIVANGRQSNMGFYSLLMKLPNNHHLETNWERLAAYNNKDLG